MKEGPSWWSARPVSLHQRTAGLSPWWGSYLEPQPLPNELRRESMDINGTNLVYLWYLWYFESIGIAEGWDAKGQAVFSRLPSTIHTWGLEATDADLPYGPGFPQGSNFSEPSSCINSTCNNMTSMTPGCLTWASWLIKQLLLQVVWRIHRVYHSILDGLDGLHYIAVLPGMTKAISHVDFGALTPSAICAVMCSDVQCTQASILSISLWWVLKPMKSCITERGTSATATAVHFIVLRNNGSCQDTNYQDRK